MEECCPECCLSFHEHSHPAGIFRSRSQSELERDRLIGRVGTEDSRRHIHVEFSHITMIPRQSALHEEYVLEPKPELECELGKVYLAKHSEPKNIPWHLVTFGRNFATPEEAAQWLNDEIVAKWNDPPTEEDIRRENELLAF